MGLFGSISGKEVDAFAKSLARELAERLPPAQAPRSSQTRRLDAALDDICRKALAFKQQNRLGVYKTARLGNTFRWELAALGYEERFTEDATQYLVVRIAPRR